MYHQDYNYVRATSMEEEWVVFFVVFLLFFVFLYCIFTLL